jgi:hypothetical protein
MLGFPHARVILGGEIIWGSLEWGQYERPNAWFSPCEGDSGRGDYMGVSTFGA